MSLDQLISTSVPLVAVGALLAAIGQGIGMALGESQEGWRGAWHRTRTLHPILAGLFLGCTSLPVPEAMGEGLSGRVIWYGLAGALAVPLYEMVRRIIDRKHRG